MSLVVADRQADNDADCSSPTALSMLDRLKEARTAKDDAKVRHCEDLIFDHLNKVPYNHT